MIAYGQSYAFITACYNSLKTALWLDGEKQHPHRFLMWSFCHIYNIEDVNLKKNPDLRGFYKCFSLVDDAPPPPPTPKCNLSFRHIFNVVLSMTLLPVKLLPESVLSIRIKTTKVSFGTQKEHPRTKSENVMSLMLGHIGFYFLQ